MYLMDVDHFPFISWCPPCLSSSSLPWKPFFPTLFSYFFKNKHTHTLLFFLFELHTCYTIYFYFRCFPPETGSHYGHTPAHLAYVILRIEPKASCMRIKHSTSWAACTAQTTPIENRGLQDCCSCCLILPKATKTVSDWAKIWAQNKSLCS